MNLVVDAAIFGITVAAMLLILLTGAVSAVPGVLVIWLTALVYTIYVNFAGPGPLAFAVLTLVGLVGSTTDLWIRLLGVKARGTSLLALLAGAVLGLIGLIVFFPFGGIIGSTLGVVLVERIRTGSWLSAFFAGTDNLAGWFVANLAEFIAGLLLIVLFVASVLLYKP